MSQQAILSLSNLSKRYDDHWAVQNLNIQVAPGAIFGFLGRNGAGKTTTIRMIMNLIRPTSGEIRLFGKTNKELKADLFKRMAATIEYPGFYLNLTARENLLYCAKMRNLSTRKVNEMLELFDLKEAANRLTREFSLGMKQRLGLARALLHEPELMILDEPTNGLDPAGIQEIREMIKKLNREKGITILFSSHILSEVEQISSKVAIIHEGKLVDEFTLEQFKKESKHFIALKASNQTGAVQLLNSKFNTRCQVMDGLIQIPDVKIQPEIVNRILIENGIDISHLSLYSETLEDRFMRLTGGKDHV
ncbi:ABC transporter ATP-binding protein [Desulforamulus ruminis]|uniref:ABC transporter related protein n=1 Tax=Desulforamulus ruminis (strain ATCC 23193 / DSM 2154 / NCIMB 8452 / DL) TaxID=696281 RepID=F6DR15_DESRL|nr:ABC transporter ATP-binding protein [Desulforamulus ruminis]AEG59734.1 ABC transporter related protein [Desulforamulus ruminis DSM 2154]